MNKNFIIALLAMTLLISLVSAEEVSINKLSNVITKSAQSQGTTFSFITGTSGQSRVGSLHIDTTPGHIPTTIGGACSVDQYVVAYQCEYATGTNCQRMFTDDWKITSASDLIPYSNWQNQQWFKDVVLYKKYSAYECLAAKTTSSDTQLYGKPNGQFLSVTWPKSPVSDSTHVHIKGQYKVTSEGYFLLEAGINPQSSTTFAVITASSSTCDSSGYYAGKRLYGKPGDIYDFDFTVKVPEPPQSKTGYYPMSAHAWTDCSDPRYSQSGKAGEEITSTTATLQVKNTAATASKCGSIDTDNDGIFDGCDVCPKDYGSATMQGCHPCFGKPLDLQSTKDCYYTNQDKYGIPIQVLDYIDPYVKTITECTKDNTQVQTVKLRQSGLRSTLPTKTTCTLPQVCVAASTEAANCQTPKAPEVIKPTETGKTAECNSDGDKVIYTTMSDGTKISQGTFSCFGNGCENGACKQAPKDPTDTNGKEEPGARLQDPECTSINDCKPGEYCLADSGKCAPKESNGCKTNADCTDSSMPICSLTIGTCVPKPECTIDTDCPQFMDGESLKCQDTFCVPITPTFSNDTKPPVICVENIITECSDGSTVMTGACKNGELYPLANSCPVITKDTGITKFFKLKREKPMIPAENSR